MACSATKWGVSKTFLNGTDLSGAILHVGRGGKTNPDADLSNAWLIGANLSYASVTNEQLGQTVTLAGATLPNGEKVPTGQKYDDWAKDFCPERHLYQCDL